MKPAYRDLALERLLLAIEVHGPSVMFEQAHWATLRWMRRNYQNGYRQIIQALRENGMERSDVVDVMQQSGQHGDDCACWQCVLRLYAQVTKARAGKHGDGSIG